MENNFLKFNFQTFMYLFVIRKTGQQKHFSVKKNLTWFSEKCFPFILDKIHFSKVMKKLKISFFFVTKIDSAIQLHKSRRMFSVDS